MQLRSTSKISLLFYLLLLVVCPLFVTAWAGTASIAWGPVADSDLAGYRVYYGTSPGDYSYSIDVPPDSDPEVTITGLTDCIPWYFSIKAFDTDGNFSENFSNEVDGWARPELSSVRHYQIRAGETRDFSVRGVNFKDQAIVEFNNAPDLTVNSVEVQDCYNLAVNISAGGVAPSGPVTILVINPDRIYGQSSTIFSVAELQPLPSTDPDLPVKTSSGCQLSGRGQPAPLYLLLLSMLLLCRIRLSALTDHAASNNNWQ